MENLEILYSNEQIHQRLQELAEQLDKDYQNRKSFFYFQTTSISI